jgi:hypothetical protein
VRTRKVALLVAAAVALALASTTAGATAATAPTLRIGPTNHLSVVGSGFRPGILVRIQLVGPGLERRATVHAGARGGFTFRFRGVERCQARSVIARATNGAGARVPVPWFIRECPPPPPLQPSVPPPQE